MAIIAISAGHNFQTGARAIDGSDEWSYNNKVIGYLKQILERRGHTFIGLVRDRKLSYTAAMRKLGQQMKRAGADLALELHFNSSANPEATGFEYLHWWRSPKSELLAQCLGNQQAVHLPHIPQRGNNHGARSLWYHRWNESKAYSGRGGAYCYLTPCPAVICEPGFASNISDWYELRDNAYTYALSLANGIDLYLASN